MCLYFPLSLSFHSVLYTFLVYIICLPRILSLLYPSFFLPFPFLHIPRLPIFKHPRTEGQETRCFPSARFRSFSLSFCSLYITGLHNMSTPLPSLSIYLPFCLSIYPSFLPFPSLHTPRLPILKHPRTEGQRADAFRRPLSQCGSEFNNLRVRDRTTPSHSPAHTNSLARWEILLYSDVSCCITCLYQIVAKGLVFWLRVIFIWGRI